ncbi:MAG: hypothetical protein GX876_01905 [Bacteroidales bacterium]|nr:hypothetical protein [Bacteroidales bacterium]
MGNKILYRIGGMKFYFIEQESYQGMDFMDWMRKILSSCGSGDIDIWFSRVPG